MRTISIIIAAILMTGCIAWGPDSLMTLTPEEGRTLTKAQMIARLGEPKGPTGLREIVFRNGQVCEAIRWYYRKSDLFGFVLIFSDQDIVAVRAIYDAKGLPVEYEQATGTEAAYPVINKRY